MLGSLPVASIPVLCPPHSDAFAKLLESGDLSMSSIRVDGISMSFQNLLAKICFHHHFSGKGPDGAGGGLGLCAHGGRTRSPRPVCCSCGARGLLRLPVQPLHPGPPRLPAGEEGQSEAASPLPPPCPPPTGGSPSSAAECRLAAPPSPGELVVAHTIGLLSPVRALVARGGSSSPSCSVGERLCACDSCFFLTRFAELTRETVQAWSLLF